MKNKWMLSLVLISMMAMLVSTAAAPLDVSGLTLSSSVFVPSKGFVFKFNVTGKFSADDLKGAFIQVGNRVFNLSCSFSDDGLQVVCLADSGLGQYQGRNAILVVAGLGTFTFVPWKYARPNALGDPRECSGDELEQIEIVWSGFDDSDNPLINQYDAWQHSPDYATVPGIIQSFFDYYDSIDYSITEYDVVVSCLL